MCVCVCVRVRVFVSPFNTNFAVLQLKNIFSCVLHMHIMSIKTYSLVLYIYKMTNDLFNTNTFTINGYCQYKQMEVSIHVGVIVVKTQFFVLIYELILISPNNFIY